MQICIKRFLLCAALFTVSLLSSAQKSDLRVEEEALTRKIFFMLHVIKTNPRLYDRIAKDSRLVSVKKNFDQRLKMAKKCATAKCMADLLIWNKNELEQTGKVFSGINKPAFISQLRSVPYYSNYLDLDDEHFVQRIWADVSGGLNRIISVYVAGQKPHYASIDSVSYDVSSPAYADSIKQILSSLDQIDAQSTFYEKQLALAIRVLLLNKRNEAIRYEPLEKGMNEQAVEKIKRTEWRRYSYSAILIPGFGPEEKGIRIDHRSVARCKMAAGIFKAGKAPFLIVSGGHVYPAGTPYSEAVEMRRYLMDSLGIDSAFIIIEPHARHTTTNARNATRLIYRLNMPDDKPVLVVSDEAQIKMFDNLPDRCIRELGYVPYQQAQKINSNQVLFYPVKKAFQINTADPLDP